MTAPTSPATGRSRRARSLDERRARAARAEHDAVVRALGQQGWVDLLARRRAARLARLRARRAAGYPPRRRRPVVDVPVPEMPDLFTDAA